MLNSLNLATDGYLARGINPTLGIAVEGLIRLIDAEPNPPSGGGGGTPWTNRNRKGLYSHSLAKTPRKRKLDEYLYPNDTSQDAVALRDALETLRNEARALGAKAKQELALGTAKQAREISTEILPLPENKATTPQKLASPSNQTIILPTKPSAEIARVAGIEDDEALLFLMSMH